jgi:two-component system, LytTR family, response regulator
MNVILIDDEPLARALLREYLAHYPDLTIVAECENGFEGVKAIAAHQPDLVFLDIQMPKINGFEMLELLADHPPVIFTTAFDEYAIRAFETQALDYLLKPFSPERLESALRKWRERMREGKPLLSPGHSLPAHPQESKRIVVKKGHEIRVIPLEEVLALEAWDDYVKVHTKEGYYLKNKPLHYFETQWDSGLFFRVHRSFLLNLNQISRIEILAKNSYVAILRNGMTVPVSRAHYATLRERIGG